jgi:hypothetical protein
VDLASAHSLKKLKEIKEGKEILIIGLCILLRVYQSIYIETSVRNKLRMEISIYIEK